MHSTEIRLFFFYSFSCFFQALQVDPKAFPDQPRDIVPLECPGWNSRWIFYFLKDLGALEVNWGGQRHKRRSTNPDRNRGNIRLLDPEKNKRVPPLQHHKFRLNNVNVFQIFMKIFEEGLMRLMAEVTIAAAASLSPLTTIHTQEMASGSLVTQFFFVVFSFICLSVVF